MTDPAMWDELRLITQARIGLGRAGNALPTHAELEFRAAHAAARDAVHEALDVDALLTEVRGLDISEPVVVTSRAVDRAEYLRRPDLGREPATLPPSGLAAGDLAIVLADGLSPRAVTSHAVPLLTELLPLLAVSIASPVVATQARVALGDHVAPALGARAVLVLIGERPGLSVPDSLGAYLTYAATPGRTDAQRNCVSNIHPPDGLGYAEAARVIAGLITASFELQLSGVGLKDRSRPSLAPAADPAVSIE